FVAVGRWIVSGSDGGELEPRRLAIPSIRLRLFDGGLRRRKGLRNAEQISRHRRSGQVLKTERRSGSALRSFGCRIKRDGTMYRKERLMMPLAAFVLLAIGPGGQDATAVDQSSVDQLIADLGSPDPQVRERAERELKKRGREAVPGLREAARSGNAERAM